MKSKIAGLLSAVVCAVVIPLAVSQHAVQERVGPLPDGGFLLNSGWMLHPAGKQVRVGTFPMSVAASEDGKFLLSLNAGYDPPTISVINSETKAEVSRVRVPDAWLGLKFSAHFDSVYVGGGTTGKVFEFSFDHSTGALAMKRDIVALPNLANKGNSMIGDVAISANGRFLYAADLYGDSISVLELASGKFLASWKTGSRPYRILPNPNGQDILVTAWGGGAIYVHNALDGSVEAKLRVGPHPTDMLWLNKAPAAEEGGPKFKGRVFVAAANTNNTYVFGVTQDGQLTPTETLNVAFAPIYPLGMTPSALAVNEAGSKLFIVCSDANAVAQVDISQSYSRVQGFIPTGWYPTAVTVLKSGELAVANGKGLGSYPNPGGPNPTKTAAQLHSEGGSPVQYVGHIQIGTIQFLPVPEDLSAFTQTVKNNSPYRDEFQRLSEQDERTRQFAKADAHESPIKHVIYIVKENRTYDQVLGDIDKGNGDKTLNLFGENVTPNLHKLATEYILYDNFYENADVSADGHNWSAAAIAPDYTMKTWPSEYGHRSKLYDFEGGEPANTPPAGYIWSNALQAGVTVRDYGQWCTNLPLKDVSGPRQIGAIKDPSLVGHVDMNYRSFDLEYPDVERAREFIREWKEFDQKGEVPGISILRMGNDHTEGAKRGALTPLSFAADNDYAVGQVVEAVSQSKAWAETAIFIIEDDAQNGPDHVDSHRAPVWVISPYTHRGMVDSTMYNQVSVLRTMELILGLRPMTHFDAGARPMFASFSEKPDTTPYRVIEPKISLTDRNPGNSTEAKESARMDFSDADRADDDELNAVIWRAVKHSDPPPPVRSMFGGH